MPVTRTSVRYQVKDVARSVAFFRTLFGRDPAKLRPDYAKFEPDDPPLVLSLNASAIYLGVALGSVVGGEVLTYAAPIDLGWIAALFPAAAFAVMALSGWPAKQYQPRLG